MAMEDLQAKWGNYNYEKKHVVLLPHVHVYRYGRLMNV